MLSVSTSPPTYRAYVIGVGGRIMDVYELACDTDERAIQAARAYVDGRTIELWTGSAGLLSFRLSSQRISLLTKEVADASLLSSR